MIHYMVLFQKVGQPRPLFRLFVQKIILVVSRIQTRIVGVEGKGADHCSTTMAQYKNILSYIKER